MSAPLTYSWQDKEYDSLNDVLRAVASDATKKEAFITSSGKTSYIYKSARGELWRLGERGPQRMRDRRFREEEG